MNDIIISARNRNINLDSLNVSYTISDKPSSQVARTYTVCTEYTYCVQYRLKAFRGSIPSTGNISVTSDPECLETGSYVSCKTYYFSDEEDDPNPPGGGGGGGGTGDPWDPPTNPCPPPTDPVTSFCDDGTGWSGVDPLRNEFGYYYTKIDELSDLMEQDHYFLIDPCNYLQQFRSVGNRILPRAVRDRVNLLNLTASDPFAIQNVQNGSGLVVNCDYFPIHITQLPVVNGQPWSSVDLFEHFRTNINSFIDNSIATFHPYASPADQIDDTQMWLSPNPLSALLHLDMVNDGTVIVSGYTTSPIKSELMVSTISTPLDGIHPVSGNRIWGLQEDPDNGGYVFYTTAVDRITSTVMDMGNDIMELIPGLNSGFDEADALWRSLQDKMINFIEQNGGHAAKYDQTPDVTFRPPWLVFEKFLKDEITLQQLKQVLGCP